MINGGPGWHKNFFRSIFSALDSFGYWILSGVFNVFFAVSSAEIISGSVVREFFTRIQLILGVIMVFKLTFTALSIIINPDMATDKQKGAGKILTRVATALVMLTLVVPINIPASDDSALNSRIRDQGILFGFLYQFQDSVIKDNILGKLILGSRAEYNQETDDGSMNAGGEIDNMADVGGVMAATVAKAFVTPTILSSADEDAIGSLNDIEMNSNTNDDAVSDAVSDVISGGSSIAGVESGTVDASSVFACADTTAVQYYMNPNASSEGILYYLNDTCDSDDGEVYAFQYTIFGGLACSIIMTIIIIGFTVDVAVRAIKLAVLRLIAPVPIISYISPGSEKDGAFGNWVKTLVSTYLDLFIRLAIIYFGAYLILLISQSFSGNGVEIIQTGYGFVINTLATIFIIIGILVFMKQAPKFLKDMLGIKGTPMGNAGLSGILGGAAMAIGGGGLAGFGLGALQGLNASAEATGQGKGFSPFQSWAQNRDVMAKIRTGDKDARGGIVGRTMDRLNFLTREHKAKKFNMDRKNFAKAKYNSDLKEAAYMDAEREYDLAARRLSSLHDPGSMMSQEDFWNSTEGLTYENFDEKYAAYQQTYNRQKADWDTAFAEYSSAYKKRSDAKDAYEKASKVYSSIDKDRANMGVAPRIIDVRTETYRSSRKIKTKEDDSGVKRAVDKKGNFLPHGSDNFVYVKDTKGYDGKVDDSDWGSSGHGSGGHGPGPGGPF